MEEWKIYALTVLLVSVVTIIVVGIVVLAAELITDAIRYREEERTENLIRMVNNRRSKKELD